MKDICTARTKDGHKCIHPMLDHPDYHESASHLARVGGDGPLEPAITTWPYIREEQGTFNCPICGLDSPHEHTGGEIANFRVTRQNAAESLPPDKNRVSEVGGVGHNHEWDQERTDFHFGLHECKTCGVIQSKEEIQDDVQFCECGHSITMHRPHVGGTRGICIECSCKQYKSEQKGVTPALPVEGKDKERFAGHTPWPNHCEKCAEPKPAIETIANITWIISEKTRLDAENKQLVERNRWLETGIACAKSDRLWMKAKLDSFNSGGFADADAMAAAYLEEKSIVDRVWKALGISTYEQAGGKAIGEIVASLRASGEKWVEIKEGCEMLTLPDIKYWCRITPKEPFFSDIPGYNESLISASFTPYFGVVQTYKTSKGEIRFNCGGAERVTHYHSLPSPPTDKEPQ